MVFVGYSSEHKAYRLLNPKSGKIVVSRDVKFLELNPPSTEVPVHLNAVNDESESDD